MALDVGRTLRFKSSGLVLTLCAAAAAFCAAWMYSLAVAAERGPHC